MDLITDAHFWVGAAFVVFLVILVVAGVHKFAWKALGEAGEKVRAQLDEANRLREEAQALLVRIQSEREQSEKLAAEILANAQDQAKRMQAGQLAERRIATAEAQAAAEVKAAAGELAAQMAEQVLTARLAGAKTDPLIDVAIGQLAGKLQ